MDWDLLRRFATPKETLGQTSLNWNQEASEKLMQLINQGEVMSKKYWVTCTNPPYLALSSADMKLYSYLSKYFPDAKNDLFAAFIKQCNSLLKSNGIQSIITQHSWMFLSRSKELREKIINQTTILSLVHLGTRAFDAIGGEVVQTVAFCIRNQKQNCYNGTYIKLVDYYGESKKKEAYFDKNNYYSVSSTIFHNVPDSMIVFWQPKQFIENFKSRLLGNVINTRVGLDTGNNDKEFSASTEKDLIGRKKWVPHTKGGQYRKWYGNFDFAIAFDSLNYHNLLNSGNHLPSRQYYFLEGITWSRISTTNFAVRYSPKGMVFNSASPTAFAEHKDLLYSLGLLNSKIAKAYVLALSPTMNFQVGDIDKVPYIVSINQEKVVLEMVSNLVDLSKEDWDSFETSWNFKTHPLIAYKSGAGYADVPMEQWQYRLSDAYHSW